MTKQILKVSALIYKKGMNGKELDDVILVFGVLKEKRNKDGLLNCQD